MHECRDIEHVEHLFIATYPHDCAKAGKIAITINSLISPKFLIGQSTVLNSLKVCIVKLYHFNVCSLHYVV